MPYIDLYNIRCKILPINKQPIKKNTTSSNNQKDYNKLAIHTERVREASIIEQTLRLKI